MDYNNDQVQETPLNIGSALKSMTGIVLLIIGVSLGLYVVNVGLGLISAKALPAIVTRVTEPGLDQAENIANNVADAANAKNGPRRVELSGDVKQLITYFIVFMQLAIATAFASTLMRCGVSQMRSDANEALKTIAASLKKR